MLTNQFLDIPEAHQPLVVIYRNGNYWNYMAPYTQAMSVPAATLDPKHPMPQIATQPDPWSTPEPWDAHSAANALGCGWYNEYYDCTSPNQPSSPLRPHLPVVLPLLA